MTNFEYVQKTISLFEDALVSGHPFTTAQAVASKIGYSTHHLGRLFQSICGESLGKYILKRRLTEAVTAISSRSLTATEAAYLYGWNDYSAFNRAVRKECGVNPSYFQSNRIDNLETVNFKLLYRLNPILRINKQCLDDPELEFIRPFNLTGLVFYMRQNEKSFHVPWRIFMKNKDMIKGVIGNESWQFSSWNENASAIDDGLWIHCALTTQRESIQDMRFFSREIPSMHVISFTHKGPIESISDTYRKVFCDWLPTSSFKLAGNMEFQKYDSDNRVKICLPIIDVDRVST